MKSILALGAVLFVCSTACGQVEMNPEEWHSCYDLGLALSVRVDRCFSQVQPYFPTLLAKKGDFQRLWEQSEVCKAFGEDQEMRMEMSPETLEDVRECGGWVVARSCDELGQGVEQFTDRGQEKFGQPESCNRLVAMIRAWF